MDELQRCRVVTVFCSCGNFHKVPVLVRLCRDAKNRWIGTDVSGEFLIERLCPATPGESIHWIDMLMVNEELVKVGLAQ